MVDDMPEPPQTLAFAGGEVRFEKMTRGLPAFGFVPGYHFKIFNDAGELAGHVNIRWQDTDHVQFASGHIGYEVCEPFRGNRFALKACQALQPWLPAVREQFLITVDPDNLPSIRTIEALGADFLDEIDVPKGDPHFRRGSKRKKRYLWNP